VDGEIWSAVASEPVAAGTKVRVVGHEQYLLRVTPIDTVPPPQTVP